MEKEKVRAQKEEVLNQMNDVLENELQCTICSEHFIEVCLSQYGFASKEAWKTFSSSAKAIVKLSFLYFCNLADPTDGLW